MTRFGVDLGATRFSTRLRSAVAGGGTLSFVGSDAFSHHAGEIRADGVAGGYDVTGDLDGDGKADFHLIVTTPTPLSAGDFIF